MSLTEEALNKLFAETVQRITKCSTPPPIKVSFYPYAGLNSYIRMRNGHIDVRLCDILRDAPREFHSALSNILVAKLFRRKVRQKWERVYKEYTTSPAILQAVDRARQRGRKMLTGARGRVYDLEAIFASLNERYFDGKLERPQLSWSQRRTRRILGHHDHVHKTIVISKTLDDKRVPQFLLEYVLYHEMLHVKHRPRLVNGRMYYHTAEFQSEERQFAHYEEAKRWMEDFNRNRREAAIKSRCC